MQVENMTRFAVGDLFVGVSAWGSLELVIGNNSVKMIKFLT